MYTVISIVSSLAEQSKLRIYDLDFNVQNEFELIEKDLTISSWSK